MFLNCRFYNLNWYKNRLNFSILIYFNDYVYAFSHFIYTFAASKTINRKLTNI